MTKAIKRRLAAYIPFETIHGCSVWRFLLSFNVWFYWKTIPQVRHFGLAFLHSGLFVYIATASNTFLTDSIGMAMVFISTASLLVLSKVGGQSLPAQVWSGQWADRLMRVRAW